MPLRKTKEVEKHMSAIEDAQIFFNEMLEKRQASYDNKSEKWQESEKGEEEQSNIDDLEEISSDLEEVSAKIDNLFEE